MNPFDRDNRVVFLPGLALILLAVTLAVTTALPAVWLAVLPAGLILVLFLSMSARRRRRLLAMSDAVRQVLGGNEQIDLNQYREGELYVLASDLQKMAGAYREQAAALKRDKRDLLDAISDVSHQLKTPITSLYVISDVLKQPLGEAEKLAFEGQLEAQIGRLDWLVKSLLTLAKLDAAAVTFKPRETTLGRLAELAAAPFQIKADLADLTLDITGDLTARLTVDENWLVEALGNIVKNALEHAERGSVIRIGVFDLPMSRRIQVSNRGRTIPPDVLPHLFDRFYRRPDAPDDSIGIGLSISKAVIQAQGGRVEAFSADGVTTFDIHFPK